MTCATRALLPTFVAQQYSGGPQRTFRSLQAANAHVAEGRQLRIDRVAEGKTQITRGWLDIEGDPLDSCPVATKNLVFCDMLENCLNAVGAGCFAYAAFGHPLIWQTDPVKGTMCEAALRRKLTSQGFKVKDAPNDGSDRKTDGTRLGKTSLAFDFQMKRGGRFVKVEAKMARLNWELPARWKATFQSVNPKKHDVLLLVLKGLDGLYIFESDSTLGSIANNGKIIFQAREKLLPKAIDSVLKEMRGSNEEIGFVSYKDDRYSDIFDMCSETMKVHREYGMPLLSLSASARGLMCERLARMVLEALGETTGDSQTTDFDFIANTKSCEAKSALMTFDKGRWSVRFCWIKQHLHQRLIYIVLGLRHAYVMEGRKGGRKGGMEGGWEEAGGGWRSPAPEPPRSPGGAGGMPAGGLITTRRARPRRRRRRARRTPWPVMNSLA